MKKILLSSIICAATFLLTNAQSIPNSGFENWTDNTPDNWGTVSAGPLGSTTSKSTDKNSGSFAALLETKAVPMAGNVPGVLVSNGAINITSFTISGGFAYNLRPALLTGYFKSMPGTGDSTAVLVWLTKWNGTSRDTIAYGNLFMGTINSYTQKGVSLTYIPNPPDPDTAMILIVSTKQLPPATVPAGGKLYVDDLAFTGGNVGFQEINSTLFSTIFPNPASTEINFFARNENSKTVEIYDITGKKIETLGFINSTSVFSVEKIPAGIYFYQIKNSRSEILESGKFSVVK